MIVSNSGMSLEAAAKGNHVRIDLRELVGALNAVDAGDVPATAEMAVNEEKYVRDEA